MHSLNQIEIDFLDFIREHFTSPLMDCIMKAITLLGNGGLFFIIIAAAFIIVKKTRPLGLTLALALIFESLTVNVVLKPLMGRQRPYVFNESAQIIIPVLNDYSFPSGHAALAFAFAFSLLAVGKKPFWAGVVFACVMGFTRLYLYVHYPTDVLAGAIIGSLCGYLAYYIVDKKFFKDKRLNKQ
jgi:undecaprenyl-diphosphatase